MPLIENTTIHIYITLPNAPGSVDTILGAINNGASTMSEALDRLKAEVTENNDAIQSAIASITGMAQTIRDLKDDPAALEELADSLDAQSRQLVEAIVANTPTAMPDGTPTPGDPEPTDPVDAGDETTGDGA